MPVSDGVIANDLDLPDALGVIAICEVAGMVGFVAQVANETHDALALMPLTWHGLHQASVDINLGPGHDDSALFQFKLEVFRGQPVILVPVIEPGPDGMAIVGIIAMAQMKQKCRDFILLGGREHGEFTFDLFDCHGATMLAHATLASALWIKHAMVKAPATIPADSTIRRRYLLALIDATKHSQIHGHPTIWSMASLLTQRHEGTMRRDDALRAVVSSCEAISLANERAPMIRTWRSVISAA